MNLQSSSPEGFATRDLQGNLLSIPKIKQFLDDSERKSVALHIDVKDESKDNGMKSIITSLPLEDGLERFVSKAKSPDPPKASIDSVLTIQRRSGFPKSYPNTWASRCSLETWIFRWLIFFAMLPHTPASNKSKSLDTSCNSTWLATSCNLWYLWMSIPYRRRTLRSHRLVIGSLGWFSSLKVSHPQSDTFSLHQLWHVQCWVSHCSPTFPSIAFKSMLSLLSMLIHVDYFEDSRSGKMTWAGLADRFKQQFYAKLFKHI